MTRKSSSARARPEFHPHFMLVIGPDQFAVRLPDLLHHAGRFAGRRETLFRPAGSSESLCTQVLVIFIIRTRGNPLKSRAHPLLTATSLWLCHRDHLAADPAGHAFRIRSAAGKVLFILGPWCWLSVSLLRWPSGVLSMDWRLESKRKGKEPTE